VGFQPNDPGDHHSVVREFKSRRPHQKTVLEPRRFRWFVSRGSKYFDIFGRGVPPLETTPGESYQIRRRTEQSDVFQRANYRHDSARGSSRLEIARPLSGSGLILRPSTLNGMIRVREERELPFVNSLPTASFTSRASSAIDIS